MSGPDHRLYGELAAWWPLVSAPADYREEADFYARLLHERSPSPPRSLLELGSGGGNTASHLKARFESVTLVDRSPGMLEVSRRLNPACEHVEGDMGSVWLGRRFDCVFLHDAVCYATSLEELRAVLETLAVHCRPGGVAVVVPDYVRETFREGASRGGRDGEGHGLRYLAWTRDPDPSDSTYVVDYAFLLRRGDEVRVVHDRHVEGLFGRAEWLELLASVGFEAEALEHRFSDMDRESVVFVGVRRGAGGRGT